MRTSTVLLMTVLLMACGPAPERGSSSRDTAAPALPSPSFDSEFWRVWGDGQAEVAGYRLTMPRYGQPRPGTAVTIFVTETFSEKARVKADRQRVSGDTFPVMKLNLIKDFQTGIYDYNEMTSVFVGLAPHGGRTEGGPVKVSFSSQEWCGQVWHQVLFDHDRLRATLHSYFEGEADAAIELERPAGGVSEDQLALWARGLAAPRMEPGETREVAFLPSLESRRHAHRPLAWGRARLTREAGTETVRVPAGEFRAEVWRAEIEDGAAKTFWIEADGARRILRWETEAGEKAELLGADRLKYWQMNRPGGEKALERLGLRPQHGG